MLIFATMKAHVVKTILMLLLLLTGWQQGVLAATDASKKTMERDRIVGLQADMPGNDEGTLTDGRTLYRTIGSRPWRVQPSGGGRPSGGNAHGWSMTMRTIFHSHYSLIACRGGVRCESMPHAVSASCQYYVIALRHIIR